MEVKIKCSKCGKLTPVEIYWCRDPENPPDLIVICPKCLRKDENVEVPRKSGRREATTRDAPHAHQV